MGSYILLNHMNPLADSVTFPDSDYSRCLLEHRLTANAAVQVHRC